MKNTKLLLFAALVCLMAVSCKKDEGVMDITLDKFVMGDTGFVSNDNSKVALQFSANKLIYEEGDVVKVNGETYTLSKSGSGSSTVWYANGPSITGTEFYCVYADGVSTTISSLSGNSYHYNLSGRLTSATNKVLMGGVTENNVLTLHPACAIIRLPVNNTVYSNVKVGFDANKVYKEGRLNITSDGATITGTVAMTGVDNAGLGADFLYMEYNSDEGYWYVAVPVSNSVTTKLYFYWELNGDPVGWQTSGNVTLYKGYVYTVGATHQTPFNADGTSKNYFQVGADEYVQFSPGNLQARKRIGGFVWQFAETQLQALGSTGAAAISGGTGSTWDLFGFGTSNWNGSGAEAYSPSSYVDDPAKYIGASIAGTNADWGIYNGSSIQYQGSASGTTWRTLTSNEWLFLMGRSDKVALATVKGIKGILLLPDIASNGMDEWEMPESVSLNYDKTSYGNNTISESSWNTLEAAGAIFLPVTGYRQGTGHEGTSEGHYWSSTYDGVNSDGWDNYAYGLKFTGSSVSVTSIGMFTSEGRAVRLVHTPSF